VLVLQLEPKGDLTAGTLGYPCYTERPLLITLAPQSLLGRRGCPLVHTVAIRLPQLPADP
jgi:hypothetical protein